MRRNAFTMVELVFVIVILGILAAVAIPKLAASRDDAQVSKEVMVLSRVVGDLGAQFTATGAFALEDITIANAGMGCYSVVGTEDGNLTVTEVESTVSSAAQTGATEEICTKSHALSQKQKMSGVSPVTHKFGGSNTSF